MNMKNMLTFDRPIIIVVNGVFRKRVIRKLN